MRIALRFTELFLFNIVVSTILGFITYICTISNGNALAYTFILMSIFNLILAVIETISYLIYVKKSK